MAKLVFSFILAALTAGRLEARDQSEFSPDLTGLGVYFGDDYGELPIFSMFDVAAAMSEALAKDNKKIGLYEFEADQARPEGDYIELTDDEKRLGVLYHALRNDGSPEVVISFVCEKYDGEFSGCITPELRVEGRSIPYSVYLSKDDYIFGRARGNSSFNGESWSRIMKR
ncbi:hypothetical protein FACS189460_3710 [Deltaproteobacteria bacterium]|nr:hypothetical protein FACS189460_3710 [Deltaproteobacteria bacterium]